MEAGVARPEPIETVLARDVGQRASLLDIRATFSDDMSAVGLSLTPYWESDVHEIMPYEKGKEILRAVMKAAAQK
jgi:hypothetical protein